MSEKPIMSVSGIRGKIGESLFPETYTAIAYIQTKLSGGGSIVVGRDTRPNGDLLAKAAFRGIRLAGGKPIDIGIAPTPTTCFAVLATGASGGIIITASHNPLPYNGYKMVHKTGRLFAKAECEEIYDAYNLKKYPNENEWNDISDQPDHFFDAVTPHVKKILDNVDVNLIKNANLKVAIDSINGAGGVIFPKLLKELGVKWEGVYNELDGNFVHNPEPRPDHLKKLSDLLKNGNGFCAGFAFDPDADRLAPMGENGESLSEEMTLALALQPVLSKTKTNVATNLSTSMMIDDVAEKYGAKVIRTPIGEANVVEGLHANNCKIAGEGNGGVIYPTVTTVRDGLCGIALILELIAKEKKNITELCKEIKQYPIEKIKIPVGDKNPTEVIDILTKQFKNENIDTQDGLKIIKNKAWVHIRASNTEPILRCFAEAQTSEDAKELSDMIINKISKL